MTLSIGSGGYWPPMVNYDHRNEESIEEKLDRIIALLEQPVKYVERAGHSYASDTTPEVPMISIAYGDVG